MDTVQYRTHAYPGLGRASESKEEKSAFWQADCCSTSQGCSKYPILNVFLRRRNANLVRQGLTARLSRSLIVIFDFRGGRCEMI